MLHNADINDLLRHYPILHKLPANLQHLLCQEGKHVEFPSNYVLFDEGASHHHYFFLTSGIARVVRSTISGRELLLYRLQAGGICVLTINALLGGKDYHARGIVEEKITAVTIPQPLFIRFTEESPVFNKFIFQTFNQRMAHLVTLIEEVAFQKLDQRLANHLLQKGTRIQTTQQQLADELGSVREVISRLLQDFKTRGAVQLERGYIHILDKAILERIASSYA